MASVAFPRSSQAFGTANGDAKYCGCSSFLRSDRNLIKTSPDSWYSPETPRPPAADHHHSKGLPLIANTLSSNSSIVRHKSAFRNNPEETEQATDQDPVGKKNVHFDDAFEQTCFFQSADAPSAFNVGFRLDKRWSDRNTSDF